MEYKFGMFLGILTGCAIGAALIAFLFQKKVLDMHFDERQERARGVAFKYGFFTTLICTYVYGCTELAVGRWCDTLAGCSICCAVGITVFAVICILKDAYLSLQERPRQVMTLFAIISVINLAIGAVALAHGELMQDGILTFRAINPIVGLMTLLILLVYIVNQHLRDREDAE